MNIQTVNTNTKTNCCPHGLPVGACPICSGMGGGVSKNKATVSQKTNEWSYAKCYAFWQRTLMQKAQKEADLKADIAFKNNLLHFQKNVQKYITKLDVAIDSVKDKLPKPVAETLALFSSKVLTPIMDLIQKLPNNIAKTFNEIQQIINSIGDKLVAIFGELKLSIEKRLQKSLKQLKKSIYSFLSIFGLSFESDEEKKIDEAKRIFDMKVLKQKLLKLEIKEGKYE